MSDKLEKFIGAVLVQGLVDDYQKQGRVIAFSTAIRIARKCNCEYCKTVVTVLYDALADHGEIA